MELALGSKYCKAELTTGCDKHGQDYLLIVIKGTWSFANGSVRPLPAQAIQYSDIFTAAPGESAPLYESDFALSKPRCDVLFHAYAHAPQGELVEQLVAGFRVGTLEKSLRVVGERHWQQQNGKLVASRAQAFSMQALDYGNAYGGAWPGESAGEQHCYQSNPVGIGYCVADAANAAASEDKVFAGLDIPCLQTLQQVALAHPTQAMESIALSPVARHWLPRRLYGGTYDAAWQRDVFPFLPEDFDERFNQCAPEDQQMPYPQGGEEVLLYNLVRGQSEVRFKLPAFNKMPVRVLMADYRVEQPQAVVDTLFFEPEYARFSAVWRAKLPIKRVHDVKTVAIGGLCKDWWAAKIIGASGCGNCAKKRSTLDAAPSEEKCAGERATSTAEAT